MSLYEDLNLLEKKISEGGYDIDRFEIRERLDDYSKSRIDGRPAQRAVGREPLKMLEEWDAVNGENYVIEVFLSGRNKLDRIIYDPEKETAEYLCFSGIDQSINELMEE